MPELTNVLYGAAVVAVEERLDPLHELALLLRG